MRTLHHVPLYLRVCLGLLVVLVVGCTETNTIEVPREPFNPPPDNTFLGFFDTTTSQTTCGNCHVLHQRDWALTKHSVAINELIGNSDATPACYQCHTVSERGNLVDGAAGYDKIATQVYHDVQCESCHGPGLDHVQFPDAGATATNPPLAHISLPLDADSTTLANSASCGSCHNQNSGPGVRTYEEWSRSGHAVPVTEGPDNCAPACNSSCTQCHEAKGVLTAWGVFVNYSEKTSPELLGQTCAVCHDPHGSRKDDATGKPWAGQLRYSIDTPDTTANLCMKCHQRRAVPAQNSTRGPHSPQGPMLLGDAGYQPAGFDPDVQAVATTHGSEKNPRLCAGCHVNRLTGTDVNTGKPATSAGHLFLPIPCLDAGGLPDLNNQECPDDEVSRSWAACTQSGCHGSATQAVAAFTLSSQRLEQLTSQIWTDVNGDGIVDPDSTACAAGKLRIRYTAAFGTPVDSVPCANPTGVTATDDYNRANWDAGLLARTDRIPQIGPTVAFPNDTNQYKTNDFFISPAEGALFNVRMLLPEGGADGSHGVHNPFLAEALLRADIDELNARYFGGAAPLTASVRSIMAGPMGVFTKRPYFKISYTGSTSSK